MSVPKVPHAALALGEKQASDDSQVEPGETSGIRTRQGEPISGRLPDSLRLDAQAKAQRGCAAAVGFLLRHMMEAPNEAGFYFQSPMEGRLLDSALTLHVLQSNGVDADWQHRLRDYVSRHKEGADLFSTTVAKSVLASSRADSRRSDPVYSSGLSRILQGLRHARKRKKALLGTILAEVSAISFDSVEFDPAGLSDEVSHLFSQIYFAALKIIHGKRRGARPPEIAQDVAFLARTQATNGSWEQQSLLTLVALIALGGESPAFGPGLDFLRSMTRDDGGVAFCDNLNLWTTALAGIALLEGHELARPALHAVAEYIVSEQQISGGWAFSERVVQTDTDTTAQCAQLLLQLDRDLYAPSIEAAQAHFASRQRPDGGYPTYEVAGESEATMTANIAVIQALNLKAHPDQLARIERALSFLCEHQSPEGTFERSWSLSEHYSIFRVMYAFDACASLVVSPAIEEAKRKAARYIASTQRPDGGWGHTAQSPSDALSTSYALLSSALLGPLVPRSASLAGLDHLLSQQDSSTGEVRSIPDVVGPRPIVFNIPLLSTIFASMAFRAMQHV